MGWLSDAHQNSASKLAGDVRLSQGLLALTTMFVSSVAG